MINITVIFIIIVQKDWVYFELHLSALSSQKLPEIIVKLLFLFYRRWLVGKQYFIDHDDNDGLIDYCWHFNFEALHIHLENCSFQSVSRGILQKCPFNWNWMFACEK